MFFKIKLALLCLVLLSGCTVHVTQRPGSVYTAPQPAELTVVVTDRHGRAVSCPEVVLEFRGRVVRNVKVGIRDEWGKDRSWMEVKPIHWQHDGQARVSLYGGSRVTLVFPPWLRNRLGEPEYRLSQTVRISVSNGRRYQTYAFDHISLARLASRGRQEVNLKVDRNFCKKKRGKIKR